jgi:hypothetical protein
MFGVVAFIDFFERERRNGNFILCIWADFVSPDQPLASLSDAHFDYLDQYIIGDIEKQVDPITWLCAFELATVSVADVALLDRVCGEMATLDSATPFKHIDCVYSLDEVVRVSEYN